MSKNIPYINTTRHAPGEWADRIVRCVRYGGIDRGIVMRVRVKPRFWAFVIAVTALVFGTSLGVLLHRYVQVCRQVEATRAYRDELRAQADTLAQSLEYAQTDAYVERVARDELGMIMPGEVRYVNGAR